MEYTNSIVWYSLEFVLFDNDGGEYRIYSYYYANSVSRSGDEDDEIYDVSHAVDVPLLLQ